VSAIPGRSLGRQRGAAAVELALVAAIFLMLLIGIMETGRVLFYWNTAAEATRLGARLAVVCDIADAGAVKDAMGEFFPLFSPGAIDIAYTPAGCTVETCTEVTVSIGPGLVVETVIPFFPFAPQMPAFATTLTRESMRSEWNPACAS
jgi:Flp pilus assembly protein TadG